MERYSSLLKLLKSIPTSENLNGSTNLSENLSILSTPNEEILRKVEGDLHIVLPSILILSVHEDIKLRQYVATIFDTFIQIVTKTPSLKKQEWWKRMETSVISQRLGPRMKQMVEENEETWVSIWCFTAELIVSEDQVHSVAINCLLKIVELAFKISRKSEDVMEKAFTCWNQLISLFSLYPRIMSSQKLVELLVRPLATNLHFKQPALKMKTWDHLMNKIGYYCGSKCQVVTGPFIDYMFFKGDNSLSLMFPVECAQALQEMTKHKNVYKYYALKLVSAFPLCVQNGDVSQTEDHILGIWTGILENMNFVDETDYCQYVFYVLFSCLHEVIKNCKEPELTSKLLKKTLDMQLLTVKFLKIYLQESSIVPVMSDFMEFEEFREIAFASAVNELLDCFSDSNKKKEIGKDDLVVWDLLCEVYVSWMKCQDSHTAVDPHTLTSLLLIPLLSKQWSGAVQKMWSSVVEITQINYPHLEYISYLLDRIHVYMEIEQISGPLLLDIANNLTHRNKAGTLVRMSVFKIIFPTIERISKHLPEKDAKPLLDLLVLVEYSLSYIPKNDLSKFLTDLMGYCNTYGQPYDLRIKTKIVKLQRKMYSMKDPSETTKEENGKSSNSNGKETDESEQHNGQRVRSPLIAQSNFLQRLARAEEKKSKLKTSMSTVFGEMLGHETPSSSGERPTASCELTPSQNGTDVEVPGNNAVENEFEKAVEDNVRQDLTRSENKGSKRNLNESTKMDMDETANIKVSESTNMVTDEPTKMDMNEPTKMDMDESTKISEPTKMDKDEYTKVNLNEPIKKMVGDSVIGLSIVGRPGSPSIPSRVTVCTPVRGRRNSPEPRVYKGSQKSSRAHLTSSTSRTPAYFAEDAQDIVVVPAKSKTTPLTEHQKEVFSKRRSDIPALYQDLSQDTQTMDSSSLKEIITVHKTESKKEENENKENSEKIVPKVKIIIEDTSTPPQEPAKDVLTEKKQKEKSNVIEKSDKINVGPPDEIIENTPDIVPPAINVDLTPTKRLSAKPKNLFSSTLLEEESVSDTKTVQKKVDEIEKENKFAIESMPKTIVIKRRTGRRSACKLTPKLEEEKLTTKSKKDISDSVSVALSNTIASKTKEEEIKLNGCEVMEEAITNTVIEAEVADTSVIEKGDQDSQKSEISEEKSASTVELSEKSVYSVDSSTVSKRGKEIGLTSKTCDKITQESNVDSASTGKEEQVTGSSAASAVSEEVASSQDSQSPNGWSMTTPERERRTRKPRLIPVFSPKQLRSKRLSLQKGSGTTPTRSGKQRESLVGKLLLTEENALGAEDKPQAGTGKEDDKATDGKTESVEEKTDADKNLEDKALVSVANLADEIEKPKKRGCKKGNGRKRKTDVPSVEVEDKKMRIEIQSEPISNPTLFDTPEANKSIIEQKKRNSKLSSNNLENWVIKTGKSVLKSPEVEAAAGPVLVNQGVNDVGVGEPDVIETVVPLDTPEMKSTDERGPVDSPDSIFDKSTIVENSSESMDVSLNLELNSSGELKESHNGDISETNNEVIQAEVLKCDDNEVVIQVDRDKVEEDKSGVMSRRRKRRLGVGDGGGEEEEGVNNKRGRMTPQRAGRGAYMLRLAACPEEDQPPLKTTPVRRKSLAHPIHFTENWPEGRKEDWVPCVPTPPAFSSPGILKRKLLSPQTSPLSSPTSSANRKRVSFLDPPVSKGLLYVSHGLGQVQHADVRPVRLFEVEEAECPMMPSPIRKVVEESGAGGGRLEVVEDELTAIQEFLNSTPHSWREDQLANIRGLSLCDHPIDNIIPRIVEAIGREKQLSEELKKLKITSMKDLCALSREDIQSLSVKPSKFNTLYTALSEYLDSKQNNGSADDLGFLKDALMTEKEVDATLEMADSSMQTDCSGLWDMKSVQTMCDPLETRDSYTEMDQTTKRETLIDTIKEWVEDDHFVSLLMKDSQIVGSLARHSQFVEAAAQHLDLKQLGLLLIAKHENVSGNPS